MSEVQSALEALVRCTDRSANAEAVVRTLCTAQVGRSRVFELAAEDIIAATHLSSAAAESIDMIDEIARYALTERFGPGPKLDTFEKQSEYFRALCLGRHTEHCYLACLSSGKRLIGVRLMGKGTLDTAEVYVRNIAQAALRSGASYALLAHNHPGGSLKPSNADIELTRRTAMALDVIGIELLDHIIVTQDACMGIIDGGYA